MAEKKGKVRFIRKNGKVIPIRSKKSSGGVKRPRREPAQQQRARTEGRKSAAKLFAMGAGTYAGASYAEKALRKYTNRRVSSANKGLQRASMAAHKAGDTARAINFQGSILKNKLTAARVKDFGKMFKYGVRPAAIALAGVGALGFAATFSKDFGKRRKKPK